MEGHLINACKTVFPQKFRSIEDLNKGEDFWESLCDPFPPWTEIE